MVQLSRIELLGFKSFADRTRLEFGPSITAIVGPNGSGKSNIADAVRWALGEQNARILRGKTMQDLVFSGSGSRRAQGFAEVSLVFDNSSGGLPLEFSEVSISRRLYRSGDSTYLINGQECRWRDITDLLIDSGIGQTNLTVVDQVRMDRILAPDGEERRLLLESVAGVGKYRSRKRSTLRKLEETNDKIARVADIIAELETRLGPLSEQARQARTYNDLTARRRQLDTDLLQARWSAARAERDREQDKIQRLSGQIAEAEDKLQQLEQRSHAIALEVAERDRDREVARRELDGESDSWRRYREQAAAGEAAVEALTSALNRADQTVQELTAREQELVTLDAGDEQTDEERLQELVQQAQMLTQQRRTAEDEETGHRRDMGELNRDDQQLRERLAEVRARHAALAESAERADRVREQAHTRRQQLEAEQQQLQEKIAAAIKERDRCQARLDEAQAEVSAVEVELQQVTTTRDELRSDLATAQARQRAWMEAVGADDDADNKGLADLVRIDDQWLLAVEAAVAGLAEGMVAGDVEECVRVLNSLRDRGLRRTVFVNVDGDAGSVREAAAAQDGDGGRLSDVVQPITGEGRRLITQVFSQFLISDDVRSGYELFRAWQGRYPVVTRDGTLIGIGGGVTGGAAPATRRVRHLRLRECEQAITELTDQLAHSETEVERLSGRLQEAKGTVTRLLAAVGESERSVQEQEQKLAIGNVERQRAVETEATADQTLAEANSSAADVKAELAELQAQQRTLQEKRDQQRQVTGESRRQLDAIDRQITAVREQIDELKVAAAEKRARQQAMLADQAETRRRLAAAEMELGRLQGELAGRKETAAADRSRADECEQKVQALREKVEQAETALSRLRDEQKQATDATGEIRRRLSSLEGWLRRSETEVARVDTRLEQLEERVQASGIILDGEFKEDVDVNALAEDLAAVTAEIEALGPVNPLAVGEYDAVTERHHFLTEQRDDLVAGAEALERAVRRLDAEMREIFIATLRRVDEEYGVVFRELFGGGKAKVQMDDQATDPLQASVDLSVQIPGKKMTSMSLLSGGERALCAIAFLFALLRIRPLPFCVLDEIDAALDEVNTSRFSAFLRRYSQHTQFISITHQKQTMEVATALYGVTMADQGVSRVLSVRLEDIEREAGT